MSDIIDLNTESLSQPRQLKQKWSNRLSKLSKPFKAFARSSRSLRNVLSSPFKLFVEQVKDESKKAEQNRSKINELAKAPKRKKVTATGYDCGSESESENLSLCCSFKVMRSRH